MWSSSLLLATRDTARQAAFFNHLYMNYLYTFSLHILILNIYLYIVCYTYTYTYFYCHMHEQVKLYPYSIVAKTTPPAVQFEDDFLAAYIASAISSGTGRHHI